MSRGLVFCQRPRPMDRQAMRERKRELSHTERKRKDNQSSTIDRVLGCCNPNQLVFSTGAKNYSDEKF